MFATVNEWLGNIPPDLVHAQLDLCMRAVYVPICTQTETFQTVLCFVKRSYSNKKAVNRNKKREFGYIKLLDMHRHSTSL